MVTGALRRNKRNRKSMNYQNNGKFKILSAENAYMEEIYSLYKSGCIVGLKGLGNKIGVVGRINLEDKTISIEILIVRHVHIIC